MVFQRLNGRAHELLRIFFKIVSSHWGTILALSFTPTPIVHFSGDYTGIVPPDSIPNSVVKYAKADDISASGGEKVGSRH